MLVSVCPVMSLDEEDGGLGTKVNATGKGFKNGTSLTFRGQICGHVEPAGTARTIW